MIPLHTRHLSTLEIEHYKALYKFTLFKLSFLLYTYPSAVLTAQVFVSDGVVGLVASRIARCAWLHGRRQQGTAEPVAYGTNEQ